MAKILIADDDAHIVALMTLWLTQNGHETIETYNGADALAALAAEEIDLVISDVNMPLLDGVGLVQAVREKHGPSIPILLLTSSCDHAKLQVQIQDLDVQIFPKPFMPSRLIANVDELLGSRTRREAVQ